MQTCAAARGLVDRRFLSQTPKLALMHWLCTLEMQEKATVPFDAVKTPFPFPIIVVRSG